MPASAFLSDPLESSSDYDNVDGIERADGMDELASFGIVGVAPMHPWASRARQHPNVFANGIYVSVGDDRRR
ncbi:hypothetical protein SAMN05421812_105336 [Asanoa hainanensis]|uniref:Uncharacterized protein n=1 Tax=Asanoa hainanensis TaxID=560556 RepID=A0A239ME46_9ACTN|nr:hypothetical protein SAMN05421812_105336 [Asanoa hainanensis]